jgi:hypothetical protein
MLARNSVFVVCVLFAAATAHAARLSTHSTIQASKAEPGNDSPAFCHGLECPEYEVTGTINDTEIRRYAPGSCTGVAHCGLRLLNQAVLLAGTWVSTNISDISYDQALPIAFMVRLVSARSLASSCQLTSPPRLAALVQVHLRCQRGQRQDRNDRARQSQAASQPRPFLREHLHHVILCIAQLRGMAPCHAQLPPHTPRNPPAQFTPRLHWMSPQSVWRGWGMARETVVVIRRKSAVQFTCYDLPINSKNNHGPPSSATHSVTALSSRCLHCRCTAGPRWPH